MWRNQIDDGRRHLAVPPPPPAAEALPPEIPPELDRWNWGAFLLNWIWGIGNGTFIALLMFVPVANVVMPFVLGVKGSRWAWRNKRWRSVEHFRRVQRLWAIWGVVAWLGWIAVIAGIFFSVMAALKASEPYVMAIERLRADSAAVAVLGEPISTGYPWGSIETSGPDGKANFSVAVTGQKASGTLYLDARKDLGRWTISRIELEIAGRAERIDLGDAVRRSGLDEAVAAIQRGDYASGLRLLRALADQGDTVARYDLGVLYDNGRGVAQDHAEAARWYRVAAEAGHAAAQNNLASLYRNGQGVPQDFAEAVKWYRRAADQGSAMAQNNLGVMYRDGLAVAKDDVRAHMWFNLSAAKGNQGAAKSRDAVASRLTPEQLAQAQELARKCQRSNYRECD
jgi:hypothetical protein